MLLLLREHSTGINQKPSRTNTPAAQLMKMVCSVFMHRTTNTDFLEISGWASTGIPASCTSLLGYRKKLDFLMKNWTFSFDFFLYLSTHCVSHCKESVIPRLHPLTDACRILDIALESRSRLHRCPKEHHIHCNIHNHDRRDWSWYKKKSKLLL